MRTIEIKGGPIDVRLNDDGTSVCMVFESHDGGVRLFRTMPIEEANALYQHLGVRLTHTARSGGDGDSK